MGAMGSFVVRLWTRRREALTQSRFMVAAVTKPIPSGVIASLLLLVIINGCERGHVDPTSLTDRPGGRTTSQELAAIAATFQWETDRDVAQRRGAAIDRLSEIGHVDIAHDSMDWVNYRVVELENRIDVPLPDELVEGVAFEIEWLGGITETDLGVPIPPMAEEPTNLPQWRVNDELLAETLPHLPDCRYLILQGSLVTDNGIATACEIPCLAELRIANTWIHRYPSLVTNQAMRHVGRHPSLREVSLKCQPITDEGMELLSQSRTIEEVDLCNCPITSNAIISLARMPNLSSLKVGTSDSQYIAPRAYTPDLSSWTPEIGQALSELDGKLISVTIQNVPLHPKIRQAFENMESVTDFQFDEVAEAE